MHWTSRVVPIVSRGVVAVVLVTTLSASHCRPPRVTPTFAGKLFDLGWMDDDLYRDMPIPRNWQRMEETCLVKVRQLEAKRSDLNARIRKSRLALGIAAGVLGSAATVYTSTRNEKANGHDQRRDKVVAGALTGAATIFGAGSYLVDPIERVRGFDAELAAISARYDSLVVGWGGYLELRQRRLRVGKTVACRQKYVDPDASAAASAERSRPSSSEKETSLDAGVQGAMDKAGGGWRDADPEGCPTVMFNPRDAAALDENEQREQERADQELQRSYFAALESERVAATTVQSLLGKLIGACSGLSEPLSTEKASSATSPPPPSQ